MIPIRSITGLTSLEANVKIEVNSHINGERPRGELKSVATTNDERKSQATVSGGLLGQIAA